MITFISDISSAKARKFWVVLAGIISLIVSANILPDQWKAVAEGFLGLLTAVGVYAVPNAPAVPAVSDTVSAKMDKGSTIG